MHQLQTRLANPGAYPLRYLSPLLLTDIEKGLRDKIEALREKLDASALEEPDIPMQIADEDLYMYTNTPLQVRGEAIPDDGSLDESGQDAANFEHCVCNHVNHHLQNSISSESCISDLDFLLDDFKQPRQVSFYCYTN